MQSISPARSITSPALSLSALTALATLCAASPAYPQGGPTPSPAGAAVYFVDIKEGATLPTKPTIHFGLRNMGVAPAGLARENAGHHHLIVDVPTPPLDKPIPNDFNHLHFGAGQTDSGRGTRHHSDAVGHLGHLAASCERSQSIWLSRPRSKVHAGV